MDVTKVYSKYCTKYIDDQTLYVYCKTKNMKCVYRFAINI